jgi:hypothetical protein
MIVAWHEVPGTTPPQKNRPVGYGMIRAGVVHRFEDWREEISNAVSKQNNLPTGDGLFGVGIPQASSITLNSNSKIIGHKSF